MPQLLVALDLGRSDAAVLAAASELALRAAARLHVVHVAAPEPDFVGYEPGPTSVRDSVAEALRDEHRALEEIVARLRARGIATEARLLRGATAESLAAEADRIDADAIVVGRHARGALRDTLGGSTARRLLHGSRRPVLVVPPHAD